MNISFSSECQSGAMLRLCLIFLGLCVLGLSSKSFAKPPIGENPNFTHLMNEPGETVGEIRAITQDPLGFIWFAGKNGLARYDGYRYVTYKASADDPRGLTNNNISNVLVDREGELWFTSEGGGVMRYHREMDRFHSYRHDIDDPSGLPSDGVYSLYEDSHGVLWAGTYNGLSYYDRTADRFVNVLANTNIAKFPITDIIQIGEDEYMFTTMKGGVFRWHRPTDRLTQYLPDSNNGLTSATFFSLYKDKVGTIWVGSNIGLSIYNAYEEVFKPIDLSAAMNDRSSLMISHIFQDSSDVLWLSTDGGGLIYVLPDSREIGVYSPRPGAKSSLSSYTIRTVMEDNNGDLWIGAFPRGVNFFDRSNDYFNTYRDFARSNSGVYVNNVWGIEEDEKGNLFVGTDGAGLVYYDRQARTISTLYDGEDLNKLLKLQKVLSLFIDSRNNLWAGSWNQGLARMNLKTKEVRHYRADIHDPNTLLSNNVWQIYEDSKDNIWVSTSRGAGGVHRYNEEEDNFTAYRHDPEVPRSAANINSWGVFESRHGGLWSGSNIGIDIYNYETDDFTHLTHDPNNPDTVSDPWVTAFYEDSRGKFWVATGGGGLNLFNASTRKKVKDYRVKDGLANDSIFGILEDDSQNLWLSTRGGLSRFNPVTEEFTNYTSVNWLQDEQFNINSALKLKSGELVFGGINGFTIFDPNDVTSNTYIPPVYLTELKVFGEKVVPAKKGSPLKTDIQQAQSVAFSPEQSVFSFQFTALNYRAYQDNKYMYRLKGFDKDWIGPTSINQVIYTNLDAGDYVFEVKGSNNMGMWNDDVRAINVKILPHHWETWWAYMLYSLIIASVIFWYVYSSRKIIGYQKITMKNLQQIDKLKDKFVASTSHELRTPLFGIVGLAETFLADSKDKLTEAEQNTLNLIVVSGKRLIAQVNDILDFSKIRDNSLAINTKPTSLYEICEMTISLTQPLLFNKNVEVINEVKRDLPAVMADDHRLQQILINLVSNAFKFTDKGQVKLSARVKDDDMLISVSDSGRGIPKEKFHELFKEFTQLEDVDTRGQGGAGLGLSITKKLVELQGGTVWVQSKPGVGSTFNFTLPLSPDKAESTTVSVNETIRSESILKKPVTEKTSIVESKEGAAKKDGPHILIVDDETVNRIVLKAYLKDTNYVISEAASGEQALSYLENNDVDLVVLDIMMPGLSGYQVCEVIRQKQSSRDLPVIFASAKSQKEDFIRGFEVGGNDFLDKPIARADFVRRVSVQLELLDIYRSLKKRVPEAAEKSASLL